MYVRFISEDGDYWEYNDVAELHKVEAEDQMGDQLDPLPHMPELATELKLSDGSVERIPNDLRLDKVSAASVEVVDD